MSKIYYWAHDNQILEADWEWMFVSEARHFKNPYGYFRMNETAYQEFIMDGTLIYLGEL